MESGRDKGATTLAQGTKGPVEAELRTLFEVGVVAGRPDGELLDLFLAAGGPAAEVAFAALVERYGPMVWRICRDVLREANDADDAFQATFLLLARHARGVHKRSSLGSWLYAVALRVARRARSGVARRRECERVAAEREREQRAADIDLLDAASIVHEEVGRLPEKLRSPLVLCYFEGLTHDQAATRLGWPVGTVRSRLAGARDRLRPRLLRRGIGPSVAVLATAGRAEANAAVPTALVSATIRMAIGSGAAGTVPASVAALVGKTSREMTVMKLSLVATGPVAAALVGMAGVGYLGGAERPRGAAKAAANAAAPGKEGPSPKADAARAVTVAAVRSRTVTLTQPYVGRIEASHHIEVRAPGTGYLAAIEVREGQAVKKSDLLFQLGPVLGEKQPDAKGGDGPTAIKAPFDGVIGRLSRQLGSLVREGEPLTSLSDNSRIRVYFNVPEAQYLEYIRSPAEDREGRKIEFRLANGSRFSQPGKLGAIEAEFNNATGNIPFRADFPNPDRLLRHGQTGTVTISREEKDAIVIPQRATFEASDKRCVYVVDKDGLAHRREIAIRAETDELFVIERGLDVGERIVVDGVRRVHDGDEVKPDGR